MSDWIELNGRIDIYKKDRVSIKEVITNIYTDDFSLDLDSKDCGEYYRHKFQASVCIDGGKIRRTSK